MWKSFEFLSHFRSLKNIIMIIFFLIIVLDLTAIYFIGSKFGNHEVHLKHSQKGIPIYSFDHPEIAYQYLKQLDPPQMLPPALSNNLQKHDRVLDYNYCNSVKRYFATHSDQIFLERNVLSDYGGFVRNQILPKIKSNIHKLSYTGIGNNTEIPQQITIFFMLFILHRHFHFEEQFGCLNQMHNHIYDDTIFNTKSLTAQAYSDYIKSYETKPQCITNFMPDSYLLANSTQCIDFFNYITSNKYQEEKKEKGIIFFRKIAGGVHKGQGVLIFEDQMEKIIIRDYDSGMKCGLNTDNIQMQRNVPNLLLVHGHKFDFRVYLLIASTNPVIAYYHDGFLKLSVHPFEFNSTNNNVHLSNTHLAQEAFEKAKNSSWLGMNETELRNFQTWTFERLQNYLLEKGYTNDTNWIENSLRKQLKEALIHLVRMTQHAYLKKSQLFEIFGCDFVLDENLKIWFIESNTTPSLAGYSLDREKILVKMVIDMFDLMYGYLKSRLKRVILFINKLPQNINSTNTLDDNYENLKSKFDDINTNNMELEFRPSIQNGFYKIVDENLEGIARYSNIITEECL